MNSNDIRRCAYLPGPNSTALFKTIGVLIGLALTLFDASATVAVPIAAPSGTILQTYLSPDRPNSSNAFGSAIAAAQDSIFISDTSLPSGAVVYQFDRGGNLLGRISNPVVPAGLFGTRMAVLGDRLFVHGVGDGSSAGAIYMFDPTTRQYLGRVDPPASGFRTWGSSLARSGNLLVVGNTNRYVPVYDLTTGQIVQQFNDPAPSDSNFFGESVEVIGDTAFISSPQETINGSGAGDGVVYAYDLHTGQLLRTLGGDLDEPNRLGTDLAVVGNDLLAGDFDTVSGRAYLFDAQTGQVLHRFDQPAGTEGAFYGTPVAGIADVAVVGTSTFQRPGTIYFYDHAGQLLDSIDSPIQNTDRNFVWRLAPFGNDLLASAPSNGAGVNGVVYLFATPVPEPSTICLAGFGMATLICLRRRPTL
jgi:hypothetical protein